MRKLSISLFSLLLLVSVSCKNESKEETPAVEETETAAIPEYLITVSPLEDSPAYADAKLILDTPEDMTIEEAGEVNFDFQLENYELGAQTNSPNATNLANSGKGQHIHFILNNQPYSAHYEATIKKEIPEGVHHLVAFLSRSYHESVKNDSSVVVKKLVVGAADDGSLAMDAPTLIYSRPKGTYSGNGAKRILLDFFVLNTELSETGNKVEATINGEKFTLTKWQPYVVDGLPMGEVTVKLELVDAEGNVIEGPFNSVERVVTLKE